MGEFIWRICAKIVFNIGITIVVHIREHILMAKNFLVTDFEFTVYTKPVGKPRGFFSEILEIGATKLAGDTFERIGDIQSFVKPQFYPKQAEESLNFSMITMADLKKGILFPEMIERMKQHYIPSETYFVAWGDADFKVIDTACKRYKIENPVMFTDYLDLAAGYKLLFEKEKTPSLKSAAEEQNVVMEGTWHTALDDAINTSKLLVKLLEGGWDVEAFMATQEKTAY